ncbi:MAG TPA: anti-sigma factor [Longimicrobiales bacterium]|nr:anti-sigma factor [Longimicrobiales bacterium]
MNQEHTFWTDRLSEALDGTLPPPQAEALEDHLAACPACRQVRAELEEVRRRARAMEPREPAEDLWLEIAPRLHAATLGDKVIPMHGGTAFAEPGVERRRVRLSFPQAAAAALVLALGGALAGSMLPGTPAPATPVAEGPVSESAAFLASSASVPPGLFEELQTLEEAFRADLSQLEPETRAIIETNLETIDRAIRESVRALQGDPGSRYLQSHLGDALQRKVGYLQQVTRLLET